MRKITYLAVLEPTSTGYSVFFPDFLGCISVGANIQETSEYAREALELHTYGMERDGEVLPTPSVTLSTEDTDGCLVVPITIYPDLVKNKLDDRKVKTNCTLPAWIKALAEENKLNYSQLLETSIKEVLGIKGSR